MLKSLLATVLMGTSLLVAAGGRTITAAQSPLQGTWQITNPGMAGLFIFSGTHYSMLGASPDRPDIADLSKASADDVRAIYNPMIGNTGVFDINGNQVTIRPVAAKIPVVMKPGAYEVYEFKIDGKNLTLTQRRNVRGPVEQGNVWTATRVE
jgi:hypothetical protein